MADVKELAEIKADIEHYKKLVREDIARLNVRFHQQVGPLSPTHLASEHVLMLCGTALIAGFIFGYQGVPLTELAKPAVRTILTTAGKHAAIRLIRG